MMKRKILPLEELENLLDAMAEQYLEGTFDWEISLQTAWGTPWTIDVRISPTRNRGMSYQSDIFSASGVDEEDCAEQILPAVKAYLSRITPLHPEKQFSLLAGNDKP